VKREKEDGGGGRSRQLREIMGEVIDVDADATDAGGVQGVLKQRKRMIDEDDEGLPGKKKGRKEARRAEQKEEEERITVKAGGKRCLSIPV